MHLHHIIAAADDSEAGRAAILAAAHLASRCHARVTVLTVASATASRVASRLQEDGVRGAANRVLRTFTVPPALTIDSTVGLPGIEIGHYAETHGADLIVVGRKQRSSLHRLLVGDTADSVARRSSVPCLFVPAGASPPSRVLAALDGTERGLAVLVAAMDFTRDTGGRLRAVSVEPAYENEKDAPRMLTTRSAQLLAAVNQLRLHSDLGPGAWDAPPQTEAWAPVAIHRGRVVEEVVREATASSADVLVIGSHRGGPAGIVEAGSVARRLTHEAPCSVLTIPL
jgi:nucleotide-binding universal stress UspA family protein